VIVHSTIDLGRNLGLRVVAEGVEDPLTLQQLDLLGCHAVQG
jgi:diguanylate cyclase